jgi:hypothetical protein
MKLFINFKARLFAFITAFFLPESLNRNASARGVSPPHHPTCHIGNEVNTWA